MQVRTLVGEYREWGKILPAVAIAAALFYVLAFDQGLLLSAVQGDTAFAQNYIHELMHDARHAAGFPCH